MTAHHRHSRASLRAALLAFALGAAATVGAQTAGSAKPQAPVAMPVIDVAADPAQAWRTFLDTAEFESALAAYGVLTEVGYSADGVDADACRTQRDALKASIRAVPISIALRRAGMLCAEALGDAGDAEREVAALAALSKHALVEYGDGAWRRPIRVLQPWDIYALIHSLGYEFRYEYYSAARPERYFPLVVAAWDGEKKVERHLAFDFIDAIARIDRTSEYAGFAYQRNDMSESYINAQVESEEPIGFDAKAILDASVSDGVREQVGLLRAGAERGGMQSAMSWLMLCAQNRYAGCADGLIDALLPAAEREYALPMTLLAIAYREGIGLKQDVAAGDKLLAAANARWYREGASVFYVSTMRQIVPKRWSPHYDTLLRPAKAAGNRDAEALLALRKLIDTDAPVLTDDEIAVLMRAENNTIGRGYAVMAEYYENRKDDAKAAELRRLAAQAGNPAAQRAEAFYLRNDVRGARLEEIESMMGLAAHGGDAMAMRYMADRSERASDWKAASYWLLPAVRAGDIDAVLDMAQLFEDERPGVNGNVDQARDIYLALAEHNDVAAARRRLAAMALEGRGMAKNPKKAETWLLSDAERGDVDSQVFLAAAYLYGDFGKPDLAAGERWANKAISAGSLHAKTLLASWLLSRSDKAARSRGLRLMGEAEAEGQPVARNNLAWELCVSHHGDLRDPVAGLVVAKRMERDLDKLDYGDIDTVATCYAATGDFARAVELQQRALAAIPKKAGGEPNEDEPGLRERLEMYTAQKAYLRPTPAAAE